MRDLLELGYGGLMLAYALLEIAVLKTLQWLGIIRGRKCTTRYGMPCRECVPRALRVVFPDQDPVVCCHRYLVARLEATKKDTPFRVPPLSE